MSVSSLTAFDWARLLPLSLDHLLEQCCVGAGFIALWVISTPLRNVGWTFGVEVCRVLGLNGCLWNECLHQYQDVLRDEEVCLLRGATYVYALWGAVFAVPMQVLSVNEERYGDYGRMLRHWWTAAYATFHEYLPDLIVSSVFSAVKYAKAIRVAFVSCCRRTCEIIRVFFLTGHFAVSLAFFAPIAVYDLLEYCLMGEIGVAVALLLLNGANCYFHWTPHGIPLTIMVVTEGLVAHLWRNGKGRAEREQYSPVAVVLRGLQGLRERADARRQTEAENLLQLRGAVGMENSTVYKDANSGMVEPDDSGTPVRSPAAISAELRAAEERSATLRHELALHSDVRRGRRTSSRGGCPVSEHAGVVPEDRVQRSRGTGGRRASVLRHT